ncbi:MAG: hypothetical protein M0T78_01250 [Actinomycetota bacterium]|nr:hypothetical protein [Actinomycetota bacterium]
MIKKFPKLALATALTTGTLQLISMGSSSALPSSGTPSCAAAVQGAITVSTCTLTASDGSNELIQIPSNFNGNVILYSHGYVFDGQPLTAVDGFNSTVVSTLLAEGDALAGSSYAVNGWGAVQAALTDQINTLNDAKSLIANNSTSVLGQTLASNSISDVYATGVSLGGMITAALVQQNPNTFNGALPACGVVGNGVPAWNRALYSEVAFKTLFDTSNTLSVTGIPLASSQSNYVAADTILGGVLASSSPASSARLALVSALGDIPTWFSEAPAGTPTTGQIPFQSSATPPDLTTSAGLGQAVLAQADWLFYVDFPFAFGPGRADLEAVAGGNPSWTNGANYAQLLASSPDYSEVKSLYAAAGLNLSSDLSKIQQTTPITSNPAATKYLEKYYTFNGNISIPVLSMHTEYDGLVAPANEATYANAVDAAGNSSLLKQVFVSHPGHCAFTSAEYLSAIHGLMTRVTTGSWSASTPTALNAYANTNYGGSVFQITADTSSRSGTGSLYSSAPSFDTNSFDPGSPISHFASGYVMAAADGGVFTFNNTFRGSAASLNLNGKVVGIARTPDGNGYWLVGADGGVFTYGDATYYGSLGGTKLNKPIVGITATPDGKGYWLVASDGGIFTFGDATFQGSLGGTKLNAPVVGMALDGTGNGYWLVASDGGIFTFGDATFQGSLGGTKLNAPVVGMTPDGTGNGYWLVASDGGVFTFGDATFQGSLGGTKLNAPVVGIVHSLQSGGYDLVASDGGVFTFGSSFNGSLGNLHLNAPITSVA